MSSSFLVTLPTIHPRSRELYVQARARQAQLTKPPQSLGRLEDLSCEIVAAMRTLTPKLKKRVLIFAADHGVTEEGISAYPREVTAQMLGNFSRGGAAINAIASTVGASLSVINVGVSTAPQAGIIERVVCAGTQNFAKRPAMSEEEMMAALRVGREIVEESIRGGDTCFAIGEMGIGNTTSASAITAALTGLSPQEATGRGTGVSDEVFSRKVALIERALSLHASRMPQDVLRCLGGLEIAAMVGAYLAVAAHQKLAIFDGFISTAAAAIAVSLQPAARDYLFASHRSVEPGHHALLAMLRKEPLLDLQMRLGEGSGAALAMPILEVAVATFTQMATFAEASVSGQSA